MEQRPMSAGRPLAPPDPETALAYLAEAASVDHRREERIDRRMLGWLHLADGALVGAFFAVGVLATLSRADSGQIVLLMLGPLLLWMDLSGQLRDRIGTRPPWFPSWSLPYLGVFASAVVITLLPTPPLWLAAVPFVVSMALFGVSATRQWRQRRPGTISEGPEPFTRAVAVMTVLIGLLLASPILALGRPVPIQNGFAFAILALLLGLTIAQRASSRLAEPAKAWRTAQWGAFIVALSVLLVLIALGELITVVVSSALGVAVIVLFAFVAVWGYRRGH